MGGEDQDVGSQICIWVSTPHPRIVWTFLRPCLLDSTVHVARRMASFLIDVINNRSRASGSDVHVWVSQIHENTGQLLDETTLESQVNLRHLTFSRRRRRSRFVLFIQPPVIDPIESFWEGRLILWEHNIIKAQSIAGYLSTLGGGFFMCHHFTTAVAFAKEQQRIARYINDTSMAYKCMVNQAYNYIYAGKFKLALILLKDIEKSVRQDHPSENDVILKMCESARLFSRRVRKMSKKLAMEDDLGQSIKTEGNGFHHKRRAKFSKTVDDFARIRVVRDESKYEDIIKPFQH